MPQNVLSGLPHTFKLSTVIWNQKILEHCSLLLCSKAYGIARKRMELCLQVYSHTVWLPVPNISRTLIKRLRKSYFVSESVWITLLQDAVLLDKLKLPYLMKPILALYGTWWFISVTAITRPWPVLWAGRIQSIASCPAATCRTASCPTASCPVSLRAVLILHNNSAWVSQVASRPSPLFHGLSPLVCSS
jgi:hypothetical protein